MVSGRLMEFFMRAATSPARQWLLPVILGTGLNLSFAAQALAQTTPPGGSGVAGAGSNQPEDRWYFQTSLYTKHFSVNPLHDNSQRLLNLEYWRSDNYLAGLALFDNSFGQRSQYAYVGKVWRPFEQTPKVYLKLTGGFLHGYKGEFKNKIPFNSAGVAPALLPSIGYTWGRLNSELVLFGTAGVMINLGLFF
jgi:hypothetical protein